MMEFLVTMTTHVPAGTLDESVNDVRAREAARSCELAAQGHLARLWRPALRPGEWRTLGLFAAEDECHLEKVLASMPLRVWRSDEVTALSPHPNDPGPAPTTPDHGSGTEFLIAMTITVPEGTPDHVVEDTRSREKQRARELAGQGHLVRLWALPGQPDGRRTLGLWRARDTAEMTAVTESLPLYNWMTIETTPLTEHPNDPAGRRPAAGQTTGPYTVDKLAAFVVAANTADMAEGTSMLLRRNILDSLGCAVAALDGETVRAVRDQVESTDAAPRASLIGGGRTSVDQAALFNSVAVRYVDQLDTYLSPGGLCHPADNFGALLAVAESVDATGAEFMLALAVAYEVQCRFSSSVPVMARGLNHALQLAMSVAAGAARLMRLNADQTANAIAIATADNVSLAAVHSEPVSNWKGISPGITAQRAVYTTALAQRGVTGPRAIFEGRNGLEQLFAQRIDLRLEDPTLGVVADTYLKKYCALIHAQAAIETALTLANEHGIDHGDIDSVDVEIFRNAYEFAGGGSFGNKDAPQTKEQADYNLKYLLAAAFIDGQVGPEQLRTERIRRPDVQTLLRRVQIRPDAALTAGYPRTTPVRITVVLRDGRRLPREQSDFEGAPTRPLTWQRTVEKFHWLAEQYASDDLRDAIVRTVEHLGDEPVSALTKALTEVSPRRWRPQTRQPI